MNSQIKAMLVQNSNLLATLYYSHFILDEIDINVP